MAVNIPLSDGQIKEILNNIARKESSSTPDGDTNTVIGRCAKDGAIKNGCQNYGITLKDNGTGFVGKYQIGYLGLVESGYCRPGLKRGNAALLDDATWLGKNGCTSLEKFLKNPSAQDDAALQLFKKNYTYLRSYIKDCSLAETAGYCAASHLLGWTGGRALRNGCDRADGNGTSGSLYYNIGYATINGKAPNGKTVDQLLPTAPTSRNKAGAPDTTKPEERKPTDYVRPEVVEVPKEPVQGAPRVITPEREDAVKVPPDVAQKYSNTGFMDPNLVYPKSSYKKFPDTNKLATHLDVRNTIVDKKNKNRVQHIVSGNSSWEEPISPYNAQYPYNKVTESESGHVIEIDDTPGSERLHWYHRSGTYDEINQDGSEVRRIVGDSYEIIDRNGNIFINGRCNLTVGGACNIIVLADCNLDIKGNTNINSQNDVNWNVSGNFNLMVNDTFNVRTGNDLNVEVDRNRNEFVGGTSIEQVVGEVSETYGASQKTSVAVDYDSTIGNDENIKIGRNQTLNVAKDQQTVISGNYDHTITGNAKTKIVGTLETRNLDKIWNYYEKEVTGLWMKLVTETYLKDSKYMKFVEVNKPLIIDGIDTVMKTKIDTVPLEKDDSPKDKAKPNEMTPAVPAPASPVHTNLKYAHDKAAYTDTSSENIPYRDRTEQVSQLICEVGANDGGATASEVPTSNQVTTGSGGNLVTSDGTPVTSGAAPTSSDMSIDPKKFLDMSDFPKSLQISKHFTLGDILNGNQLTAQNGFTKQQMVYNMSMLAQNILDPIKYSYSKMAINSGFRIGQAASQHNKGQAADIRFIGMPLAQYEEVAKWIKDNLPVDQLILESQKGKPTSMWVHVSYNPAGKQRKDCKTGCNGGYPGSAAEYWPGIDISKLTWIDTKYVKTA